jgi:WhiB family redox-sensing transcriptional regulator
MNRGQLAQEAQMKFADLVGEGAWQERASCNQAAPDEWFPKKGESPTMAKRICAGCPVVDECLAYALEHDERFGVWGGKSERERQRIKRKNAGKA